MVVTITDDCGPVSAVLSNGDVDTQDGALSVEVDALGAFGSAVANNGVARFNPPGPVAPASTTFTSNLYVNVPDRLLDHECTDGPTDVITTSPTELVTRQTIGALEYGVAQSLAPIQDSASSTLTQTYTIKNVSPDPIPTLTLVRHIDGDLLFDGTLVDGGGASADGSSLFEFDSSDDPANPSTFVGITGALGGDPSPARWTIQPYNYRGTLVGNDGIPDTDDGVVFNDTDDDRIVDTAFDVTLSQQWGTTSLAPGASVVFTTVTRFGQRPPNLAPDAVNDAKTTAEDTPTDVSVLANDVDADGDPITLTSFTQPANGTVTENPDHSLHYVPALNFHGTDTFTYTVSDGRGGSDTATVTITVTPVNDAPVAANDSRTTPEDTPFSASVSATDVDGDTLTFSVVGAAPAGLSFNANGSYTYTPPANFHGTVSFDFKANDGTVDSNTATVTITVTPVNDRPVATDDAYDTDEDTTLNVAAPGVLGNDTDVDGDPLTASLVTGPTHGTLTLNADGSFGYVPNLNFHGTDSFTYVANDGLLASTPPATVTITVDPVNDAPVAVNDSAQTNEDVAVDVDVLANDTDVDGDTLTIGPFDQGANGTVTLVAGKLRYTPDAGFTGSDIVHVPGH